MSIVGKKTNTDNQEINPYYLISDSNRLNFVYKVMFSSNEKRITSKEIQEESVNTEGWCSCIDGALTRENYINNIKQADFKM